VKREHGAAGGPVGERLPTRPPVAAERRRDFFLHPLLATSEQWAVRGFFALWIGALGMFWWWWFARAHWVTPAGMAVTSATVLMLLLTPFTLFFSVSRLSAPRRDLGVPELRCAAVVTKSPSEPWAVVRATLEGVLEQQGVGPYDVWLADEAPDEVTTRWCRSHQVGVITRNGEEAYHRQSWPRRTRSKEGNLAYFYDTVGFDRYDVVAQFDADHVPEPDYLLHVLRGFADPRVGYVAAPSICDANAASSWAARGRLHREATFHGPLQAGHNDGFAPTCIGSHYAVRTRALRDIGGIGPELAEDFSTSFLMQAHGWKGVFAVHAIAHGDGPDTFADAMTQELQWSRSLTLFLLRYSRRHWRNLQATERVRLAYAQLWYPLFAVQMVLGFLLPPVALLSGTPWVAVDLPDYLARATVPGLVLLIMVLWLRGTGILRPVDAPVLSWEAYLFQLARWPWVALGVLQAAVGAATAREFSFKVTPKGGADQPLHVRVTAPYLLLSVIASAMAWLGGAADGVRGYRVLVVLNAVVYGVVAVAIPLIHRRERRAGSTDGDAAAGAAGAVALLIAGSTAVFHRSDVHAVLVRPLTAGHAVTLVALLGGLVTVAHFGRRSPAPSRPEATVPSLVSATGSSAPGPRPAGRSVGLFHNATARRRPPAPRATWDVVVVAAIVAHELGADPESA
jgi:cellulose synthase (UDP-forming)